VNFRYYGATPDDIDELTVGWSNVSIAFRPADLNQGGEDVVNALSEVIRCLDDQAMEDRGSLCDPHVEIRKVILMNEGVTTSWGTIPSDLSIVSLFEQRVEHRGGSPIEQGGTNDDSVQDLTSDHGLLVPYPPCDKGVVGLSGGRIGHRFVSIVAVNPAPGSMYERQFHGVWETNCGGSFGDGIEDNRGELGCVLASRSVNHCIDGSQQRPPRLGVCGIADNWDDFDHDER